MLAIAKNLPGLMRTMTMSPEKIKEIQLHKLRAIIAHAYENTPFYHEIMDNLGVKPTDIRTVEDIQLLPIISRADVKDHFDEMTARGVDLGACKITHSSGTTGEPVAYAYDQEALNFARTLKVREKLWCGVRPGDKWINIAMTRKRGGHQITGGNWRTFLKKYATKGLDVDVIEDLDVQVDKIRAFAPSILQAYPTSLHAVALEMKRRNLTDWKPQLLFTVAELLGEDTRMLAREVFNMEIMDIYGLIEVGDVSWQCRKAKEYHINADALLVEFLNDGKPVAPGEVGEIVVTSLYNKAMPLIRYRSSDAGRPSDGQCDCGCYLPTMQVIDGKMLDFLVLPDGKLVSPHVPKKALLFVKGMQRFQIVQHTVQELDVLCEVSPDWTEHTPQEIEAALRPIVGVGVHIIPKQVDRIERSKSGKIKVIVSHVSKELMSTGAKEIVR
ncbi:MAG: AMP-binding protein [Ktedonobacteraceae bacterium]